MTQVNRVPLNNLSAVRGDGSSMRILAVHPEQKACEWDE